MIDVLKGYLQVASGVTQVTRQKAMDVARQVLEGSPVAGVLPGAVGGADQLSQQVSALADELLEVGRQNRAVLVDLVRAEIETVVTRLGLAGTAELESALAASRARVVQLERELAGRDTSASSPSAARTPAAATTAKKATAKKATAKKATAKKATAKKGIAKKAATTKKATAKAGTAKKTPANKAATTKKATAKKGTAKKAATTKKPTAKKSAARSARGSS